MEAFNDKQIQPTNTFDSTVSFAYFLKKLWSLWFKPKHFFKSVNYSTTTPVIIFAAYLMGIFAVSDRINSKIMSYYEGRTSNELMMLLANHWSYYWGFLLFLGMISAAIMWLLWGWIFNLRLKWSGDSDVDPTTGRNVYALTNLVVTLPFIISLLVATIRFPDYLTYYNHDVYWTLSILVFLIWYFMCQFLVVKSQFNVQAWKAAFWFLILPLVLYSLIIYVYLSSLN